jgi:serine/threonine protein kinase
VGAAGVPSSITAPPCLPLSVAIKTISKLKFKEEQDHKDMLMEVELMARVKGHPNVIEQFDWFEDRVGFYVISEVRAGEARSLTRAAPCAQLSMRAAPCAQPHAHSPTRTA